MAKVQNSEITYKVWVYKAGKAHTLNLTAEMIANFRRARFQVIILK